MVLKDAYVMVNTVNISAWVKSLKLDYGAAIKETTAMTQNSFAGLAGLKDWSVDLEVNQDFGASAIDATMFALVGGAAVAIKIRPTSAAVGSTNPEFQGNVLVESYPPLSGSKGDVAGASIKLRGTGDLVRATSA
jgi:hypothetical protein